MNNNNLSNIDKTMNKKINFERQIKFIKGYDCIKFECKWGESDCHPNGEYCHGRYGLEICFFLKGPDGVVSFTVSTGWFPQFAEKNKFGYRDVEKWALWGPTPSDLGYYTKKPKNEEQELIGPRFSLDGEQYYYNNTLDATEAMYALVNGGDEALWDFLEKYYFHVFHNAEFPTAPEYEKPIR